MLCTWNWVASDPMHVFSAVSGCSFRIRVDMCGPVVNVVWFGSVWFLCNEVHKNSWCLDDSVSMWLHGCVGV